MCIRDRCNTASAFALDAVRDEFDLPIIGVIEPGAKVAAAQTRNKKVGVIGTVGTIGTGIHAEYLKSLDPEITVYGKACPLFVPLVEEGWLHDPVTDEVVAKMCIRDSIQPAKGMCTVWQKKNAGESSCAKLLEMQTDRPDRS